MYLALEARAALVAPVATAEALSLTRMVTTSSTWLALKYRARSAKRAAGDQSDPGVAVAEAAAGPAVAC